MKTKRYGYANCLLLALSVSREERCEVLACFHVVVKMYRYSLEEQVFIVKAYWITGSIKNCQRRFVEQFGVRNPPSKHCIQLLVVKLETKRTWQREARNANTTCKCIGLLFFL
jgi:predicted secreted Zn-dependent protease